MVKVSGGAKTNLITGYSKGEDTDITYGKKHWIAQTFTTSPSFPSLESIAPFWEPWGSTLTENYPWTILADPAPPGIDLAAGILTLNFTGTPHSGIIWSAPGDQIPLLSSENLPLHLLTNNIRVNSLNPFDNIACMVMFRKGGDILSLYLMVKGSIVGWGSGQYGFDAAPPIYQTWWYIGEGIHDINLVKFFLHAAPDLGLDPDPTGWTVMLVEIAHADPTPIFNSTLENDYICLYHPTPHVIWRCRFKMWTNQGDLFYRHHLRATDIAGKPTGPDLDSTSSSPSGEAFYSPGKWKRFDFGAMQVLPTGTYALITAVPTSPDWQRYKLRADESAPTYPLGKLWRSEDSGVTWAEIPNTTAMFEIWGWHPPPEPPPEPVISNWAPLTISQPEVPDGHIITVTTDIPVHLFMRWTDKEPLKHPLTRYRRGILIMIGTRYCFTTWHEVEQEEKGDTLGHTFILPDWEVCQTRWFYFIGTKQTEEQPSASPIFYYHRKGVDMYVISLGKFSVEAVLAGHVKLKEGAGITITTLAEDNALLITSEAVATQSCFVYHAFVVSFGIGVWHPIEFSSELWDTDAMFDVAVDRTKIFINTSGKYLIQGHIAPALHALGWVSLGIYKNGVTWLSLQNQALDNGRGTYLETSVIADLLDTDWLQLMVHKDVGGVLTLINFDPVTPHITLHRLS